jgi:hypothetical protein
MFRAVMADPDFSVLNVEVKNTSIETLVIPPTVPQKLVMIVLAIDDGRQERTRDSISAGPPSQVGTDWRGWGHLRVDAAQMLAGRGR